MLYSNARREGLGFVLSAFSSVRFICPQHIQTTCYLCEFEEESDTTLKQRVSWGLPGMGLGGQTPEEMERGEAVWRRAAVRCTKQHTAVFIHLWLKFSISFHLDRYRGKSQHQSSSVALSSLKTRESEGQKYSLVTKRTSCACGGPRFSFQDPQVALDQLEFLFQEILHSFLVSMDSSLYVVHKTHATTHIHKK